MYVLISSVTSQVVAAAPTWAGKRCIERNMIWQKAARCGVAGAEAGGRVRYGEGYVPLMAGIKFRICTFVVFLKIINITASKKAMSAPRSPPGGSLKIRPAERGLAK